MYDKKMKQIWKNGPRVLVIIVFGVAIVGKMLNPSIFFTMTNSLQLPSYVPEILFSLLLSVEFIMVLLLVVKPMTGILGSAVLLILFTIVIVVLYATGFREYCGCYGDFLTDEIGPGKILQNVGLTLLLLSSWYMRKKDQ